MWPFLVIFFFVFAYNNTHIHTHALHRLENYVCVCVNMHVCLVSQRAGCISHRFSGGPFVTSLPWGADTPTKTAATPEK